MKKFKKIWNSVATVLEARAREGIALQKGKACGSPAESRKYRARSSDVKDVDPKDVKVGDPITFVLNESLTVATHRVVEINTGEDGMLRFKTKGDANQTEDGGKGVHEKNLIGRPVFTIPYLGYLAAYIQDPPGRYIAIALVVLLLLLFILPDLLIPEDRKKK